MNNLLRGVALLLCLLAGLAQAEPRVVALSWEATEHPVSYTHLTLPTTPYV